MSRSSAEVEYRLMPMTTCEVKWLKGILSNLNVIHTTPVLLHCDSQTALHISQNPLFRDRTKHVEVYCHFVRDAFVLEDIRPSFFPPNKQFEDIFTKAFRK